MPKLDEQCYKFLCFVLHSEIVPKFAENWLILGEFAQTLESGVGSPLAT
jgi:hypothetical protein